MGLLADMLQFGLFCLLLMMIVALGVGLCMACAIIWREFWKGWKVK